MTTARWGTEDAATVCGYASTATGGTCYESGKVPGAPVYPFAVAGQILFRELASSQQGAGRMAATWQIDCHSDTQMGSRLLLEQLTEWDGWPESWRLAPRVMFRDDQVSPAEWVAVLEVEVL